MKSNNILYLSYDGILEPLGQSQILSYLKYISKYFNISLLTFEKKIDFNNLNNRKYVGECVKQYSIDWHYIIFKKNLFFISSILNIIIGIFEIFKILLKKNITIVHCRGYVSMIMIYPISFFFNFKIIFDMRGFWVDERVEWGIWKNKSIKYLFFKYIEKKLLNKSDAIITLTTDAIYELNKIIKNIQKPLIIKNIPTCVELNNYFQDKSILKIHNKNDKVIFCHVGAISTRYDFTKTILFVEEVSQYIKCQLLIINKNEHDNIYFLLNKYKINSNLYKVIESDHKDIPLLIKSISVGIFFPKPGYYLKGYFPTKLGEFLAAGKPIITSRINDNIDNIFNDFPISLIIDNNNFDNIKDILVNLDNLIKQPNIKSICNDAALKYFSLEKGASKYIEVYNELLS